MAYALILLCEVAFWVFLVAGLACRYLLQMQRLSRALLTCIPIVDLLLLLITAYDLTQGARPTFAHGLATAYIGFTIAFGPILVAWADSHFAHRFLSAPLPQPPPSKGWPAFRYELALWFRCLAAVAISCVLIAILTHWIPSQILRAWYDVNLSIAFFWFLFGPLIPLIPLAFTKALNLLKTPRYN